ncbi:MAG TPA: ABC transporter ATP-binding protein [Methylocella sp.]|nr:ABC transporter ATP-binding protein [Methylocella sp.]
MTFDIKRGEFVAVMGASGSGKSTLANLLGALDKSTSGELATDGYSVAGMSDDVLARLRNQAIGIVFQQFNLLPRMSALENVILPLNYSLLIGIDKEVIGRTKLEEVGLANRLHHIPSQLSGGQQQRVAIARALVNNPTIIIADEPTGALDTKTSHQIMSLFAELHSKGLTVILITHEPDIAAYAKRLLRFRDGELIADTFEDTSLANELEVKP